MRLVNQENMPQLHHILEIFYGTPNLTLGVSEKWMHTVELSKSAMAMISNLCKIDAMNMQYQNTY